MIRRLLLRALPESWREAVEGDLAEGARQRPGLRGRLWNIGVLAAIVAGFAAARINDGVVGSGRPRPARWLADALLDAKHGARRWRVRPWLAFAATGTVALGIGTTSAIFSVVDGVLLKPLPYPHAERLVSITRTYPDWQKDPVLAGSWNRISLAYPEFFHIRERARTLEALAVITTRSVIVGDAPSEQLRAGVVSASFFDLLGAQPSLGRLFEPAHDLEDPGIVLLSHSVWRSRFGADPAVVGQTLRMHGGDRLIAGVLPERFAWGTRALPYQLWLPLSSIPVPERADNERSLDAIARTRAGIPLDDVSAEMSQLLRENFRYKATTGGMAFPLLERQLARVRAPLLLLLAGAALLLVIACANVAGLLVGDAASRRGEIAVRTSLGATGGRIVRQLLIEALLVASAGTAAGLLVAGWTIRMLIALAPADMPRVSEIALDVRVAAVAVASAIATAVTFALVPALTVWRQRTPIPGAAGRTTTARQRAASALAVAEIALAVALVGGAALFARSLYALQSVDVGFDRGGLLAIRAGLPPSPAVNANPRTEAFEQAREQLARIPGVSNAALSSTLPFVSGPHSTSLTIPNPVAGRAAAFQAQRRFVSPEFFATTGMRIVDGRTFSAADTATAPPVAVVSQEMARRVWPSGAVGERIVYATAEHTVIGVVNDVRDVAPASEPQATFYLSTRQRPAWPSMFFILRAGRDPMSLAPAARATIARTAADLPIQEVRTLDAALADATDDERYRALLMAMFALAAALLAGVGLYSMLARRVLDRRREIGVRLALGARPAQVQRLFLGEGARIALAGTALGVPLAVGFGHAAATLLFGVTPRDLPTLASVVIAIGALTLVATIIPAGRASRVDPASVLRD